MVNSKIIIITGMVTGSISVISSLSIIVLILRLRTRFSHTFHRIMVGLSLADIFLSLAISFGTIPSPKEFARDVEFARGNTATCDVQGFVYLFGAAAAPLYSLSLQLYFLLRIKYDMAIEKLVKNVEPFLHAVPIVYGLIAAIVPLSLGSINTFGWGSCYITAHPFGCRGTVSKDIGLNEDNECTRGVMVNPRLLRWVIFGIPYILIFLSLCVTSWMMYSAMRESELRTSFIPSDPTLRASWIQEMRIHKNSQKLLKRAFAYLAAFALSFIMIMIFTIILFAGQYSSIYTLVVCLFYPLHGLYNLIVFLWPKVMKLREKYDNLSLLQSVIITIRTYDHPAPTYNRVVHNDDNTSSSARNRMSLDTNSAEEGISIFESERSIQETHRMSDRQTVSEREGNGLNTGCESLRDSDGISLSESEENVLNTSCQSLGDIDGLSVSDSES